MWTGQLRINPYSIIWPRDYQVPGLAQYIFGAHTRNSCHHQSFCQLALVGMLMLHAEANTLRPRQMTIIFQTTLSNSFSWMKMLEVWLKFHWNLYLKVQCNDTSKFFYNGFCCTQESNEEGRPQIIFVAEKWSCTVIYVVPFSGGGRLGRLCVVCGRISISTTLQNPYQIHCKYFLLIPWHVWCRCSPWKAL